MAGSAIVYLGLVIALAGLVTVVKPVRRLGLTTRRRGAGVAGAGVLLAVIGLILPAPESRAAHVRTHLDEFMPVWQFSEVHTIHVAAPPARVFEVMNRVRPDEIFLFRTLIAIRGGGRSLPPSVQKAAASYESLHDIAIHSTFVALADDPPRESVVGTIVGRPPGPREPLTPAIFHKALPPGYALAAMSTRVTPDGAGGSVVSTETRVFANSPSARRRFAVYWRLIYPGSALIRRMLLRAIERRATGP
ncbi:MAG: hypothetical protein A3H96_25765 [Acidobacteria bacterium RIFCSPLOWO2_02_FULL_67_36]|nr:MAG: hypothetical protein A3H96_25765 [Acidobacteria bacterium RIFCSPLOWO2_02_FULL_67_36]OFW19585.1 MAG: hypothetical protein A3G21_21505 [Acidobacteria bacterium RIFCSPLOWO2_12_FULL_66_21]